MHGAPTGLSYLKYFGWQQARGIEYLAADQPTILVESC
jgi:hypothetical protein